MPDFSLGLSALRSSQHALEVISNNIANANTEGYHRQTTHLEALPSNDRGGIRTGAGVKVNYIERVRNRITESSLTDVIADVSHVDQLLELEKQIEASFLNGSASLGEELDQFFGEISKLTASPDEPAQRSAVIESGSRLAGVLRQTSGQLEDLKSAVEFQITQEIEILNQEMITLSDLNVKIQELTAQGAQPNAELDARDALLNKIAKIVGITRNDYNSGELNLRIGTVAIQQTSEANQFSLTEPADGELALQMDDSDRSVQLEGGRLAALFEIYNSTIPKYEQKLDDIATGLVREVDSVHATGVGSDGPFRNLIGSRVVGESNLPLNQTSTVFPISAGDLTVSIIETDGTRRNETISIDPAVDSLEDVAAKLAGITDLSASVNLTTNQLQLYSAEGVTFDFTGSIETRPALDSFTGTSVPTFSGDYTGVDTQDRSFAIVGSGEVGISDNLFLNIYDDSGTLVNEVNIGNGYEAGTAIDTGDGLSVSLSRGSVNTGDQFQTRLTKQPDETGILAALGINSFFSGVNAKTIDVDTQISQNHERFASGKSGDAADTTNLFRFGDLENLKALPGDLTFTEFINEVTIEIGFQVNTSQSLSTSLHSLELRLEQEQGAYSGVDLNEEMVYLQQFQKSYEAAARVIQVTDEILDELFSIFR
ncbi:flagellar hook-associated protein FlgK [Planctomycetes bacterium K23_9]|uniref:Flagellar hook-associated protein 1 n=1 Tax=Stieleria marina TaxID=1930275 RepID=A0A517NT11_9BACT|nr:Flagellar hook-associated protein 1 [Planctomycetes bacterium K23_9]